MTGKHTLKAHMWVQDEIRSQRIGARSIRSEESAADFRKEQISRTAIVKHYLRSRQMNMKNGSEQNGRQTAAMSFGTQLSNG